MAPRRWDFSSPLRSRGNNTVVYEEAIAVMICVCVCVCVCVSPSVVSHSFAAPWTVARQTPLSLEFSRQEYWGGVPVPSPNSNDS